MTRIHPNVYPLKDTQHALVLDPVGVFSGVSSLVRAPALSGTYWKVIARPTRLYQRLVNRYLPNGQTFLGINSRETVVCGSSSSSRNS